MDIVHTKLAVVNYSLAQIVPEYQPTDVVYSDKDGLHVPIIDVVAIVCVIVVGIALIKILKRRKRSKHFVDR